MPNPDTTDSATAATDSRTTVDRLTGLPNVDAFERDLGRLVGNAAGPFAVVTIEVEEADRGEPRQSVARRTPPDVAPRTTTAGTAASRPPAALIRAAAQVVESSTREQDQTYRIGRTRLGVLLTGGAETHAAEVAERIRDSLSSVAAAVDPAELAGVAIGVARWPDDGRGAQDLLRAAEDAARVHPAEPEAGLEERDALAGLEVLLDAAAALIAAPDESAVADAAATAAMRLAGADDVFVALRAGRVLHAAAARGAFEGRQFAVRRGEEVWGRVWETGRVLAASSGDVAYQPDVDEGAAEADETEAGARNELEARPAEDRGSETRTGSASGGSGSTEAEATAAHEFGSPGRMLLGIPIRGRTIHGVLGLIVGGADALQPARIAALSRLAALAGAALDREEGHAARA